MTTTGTHTTGTHTTGSRASINNSQPTCIGTLPVGVGESHPSAIMSTAEASVVCYSNNIGGNSISTGKDTGGTLVSSVGCDDVETSTVVCSTNSSSALNLKCAFEAVKLNMVNDLRHGAVPTALYNGGKSPPVGSTGVTRFYTDTDLLSTYSSCAPVLNGTSTVQSTGTDAQYNSGTGHECDTSSDSSSEMSSENEFVSMIDSANTSGADSAQRLSSPLAPQEAAVLLSSAVVEEDTTAAADFNCCAASTCDCCAAAGTCDCCVGGTTSSTTTTANKCTGIDTNTATFCRNSSSCSVGTTTTSTTTTASDVHCLVDSNLQCRSDDISNNRDHLQQQGVSSLLHPHVLCVDT
eukprot:Lankesteria_metandrocarpae@DN938_c0_g1_i1.p1